ncbi:helix-turn-helix domain-containing protein [Klebsiella michiganensis]|uniref:helix-turn-helix domain-containing protein n=1 Tax=Klebsiella michiganensis TaxID=1134687 RepID=UPI0027D386D2|nr:helix-turn-helix domain-containing protein [Klebsiella michiganensis]MDQ4328825.1 helix-turn-helix domain-containing protein [Klebsiella michiganensis]
MKPEIDDCLLESLSVGVQQLQFLQEFSVQQYADSRHIADTLILDVIQKLKQLLSIEEASSLRKDAPKTTISLHNWKADAQEINGRILLARENLGLSEANLARKLNTYSDHISDWECGITEPPASMIIPLAHALKCDPLWLLTGNNAEVVE